MATYSDFNIAFTPDPFSRDVQTVSDNAAVIQAIRLLVLTMFYERPFQPAIGSIVSQLLFEPLDEISESILIKTIRDVINKFEPRATLKFVNIYRNVGPNGESLDANTIVVDVGFTILNLPNITVATIVLRRLR